MVVDAAGRSDFFWDTARLREPLERQRALKAQAEKEEREARFLSHHPQNGSRRPSRISSRASSAGVSVVSRLTAEGSEDGVGDGNETGEEDFFDDVEEEGPEKKMVCRRCGGTGFAALRGEDGVRLVCEGCGLRVRQV